MSGERRDLSPDDARRLAEYVEGRLSPAEREELEREILARPEMAAALADRTQPLPERAHPSPPGRWLGIGLPIAALLVLALLTPQLLRIGQRGVAGRGGREPEEDFRFRSGTAPTTPGSVGDEAPRKPVGLSPSGDLSSPPTHFLWTRDPGARLYRLEVQNERGRLLFFRVTSDTSVAIPEKAIPWGEIRSASWRVVPFVSRAERTPSGTVQFRIVPK